MPKFGEGHMKETILFPLSIKDLGTVYEDGNRKIDRVIAQFAGFSKEYLVSDSGERAGVLVVRNGEVLLTRQYRLLINDISYEIPGGKVDVDETPEIAAMRECLEETGVRCANLKPLIAFHPGLDTTRNYTYVFYSDDVEEVGVEECDRRVWIPLESCVNMVSARQIVDSLSIIALLKYWLLVS
jgi:8-oxo-dGTP pyrophosphatase MutT (NUDIX family)